MLCFDSASFAYHDESVRPAVDRVSFQLRTGEVLAVVGANGSGKSTVVRLSNGLLLPASGCVTVDGVDTRDEARLRQVRTSVGVVFQRPDDQIVATSVVDEVAFGPENLGLPRDEIAERVSGAIKVAGLQGLESREPHLLSGGQKQRLAIAGVLAMQSRYIVLDEPTSMIDPVGRSEVLALVADLRRSGHGILHVTHDLDEATLADRVIVLHKGRIEFAGTPQELAGVGELSEWGMEPTALMRLAQELRLAGVDVPPASFTVESLLGAL